MIKTIVAVPALEVISRHSFADVLIDTSTSQKSLHASVVFKKEQIITQFQPGTTLSYPTQLTIQTGRNIHITLKPDFLQYTNHSCDPTVFFDTTNMELICIKPLQPGDELTFFYPGTEWEMSHPFVCNCKSSNCLQLINGASHLDISTLKKYRLTSFIDEQLKQREAY